MLAEAIKKIIEVSTPDDIRIDREHYWPGEKEPFMVEKPFAKVIELHSLDALVKLIKNDALHTDRVFVDVMDATNVRVFTQMDDDHDREVLYHARADVPGFSDGYREYEKFVIELRSRFIKNSGSAYLLDLLSKIDVTEGSSSQDNGVTQQVVVRSGIALKEGVTVKPIVALRPYRTFMEVEQPESEFLVRVDRTGCVGLYEADGGMWQQEAKRNIADWLSAEMEPLVEDDFVVVMM